MSTQPERPPRETAVRVATVVGLLLIVVLAAALRIPSLGESFWLDELHTSWIVADGWVDVEPRAQAGNNTPLYFWALRAWIVAAGHSEWSLRLPSLLAGVALPLVLFEFLRRATRSRLAGLVAALIVAVDRDCVFFATEARPYAVVQLLAAVEAWLVWRAMEKPTRLKIVLVAAGASLLLWLHYTAALFVAPLALLTLTWAVCRRDWEAAGLWATGWAAAAVSILPALWHIGQVADRREGWALFVEQQPFWEVFTTFDMAAYVGPPLIALALAAALQAVRGAKPLWRKPNLAALLVAVAWALAPIALAWLSTELDWARLFIARYMLPALAGVALLAGIAVAASPERWNRAAAAALVIVAVLLTSGNDFRKDISRSGRLLSSRREDWRGAVDYIRRRDTAKPPVLVRSSLIECQTLTSHQQNEALREYCTFPVQGLYRFDEDRPVWPLANRRPEQISAEVRRALAEAGGGWIIVRGRPGTAEVIAKRVVAELAKYELEAAVADEKAFGLVSVARLNVEH